MGKPPVAATFSWQGDLRFEASSSRHRLVLDGDSAAGPSPVQTLAFSIAGCMAMDVVDIVRKGRHPVRAMEAEFSGDRAENPPRRFIAIRLKFVVHGDVPGQAVERAIALSREKYCSVSTSLRPDIDFITSYEVLP
jgi:putative redox protein